MSPLVLMFFKSRLLQTRLQQENGRRSKFIFSYTGELMSWHIVRHASVRALTFSFKRLLLPNHLANWVETL